MTTGKKDAILYKMFNKKIKIDGNVYHLEYLKYSWRNNMSENKEYKLNNINVYIKDNFKNPINLNNVIDYLKLTLPESMFEEIDSMYIGEFEMLANHDLNALYSDGAIYISNVQDSESDLIDDIIHETAHSLETKYALLIYGDGKLENEFIRKRVKLMSVLEEMGFTTNQTLFINSEYSKEFDEFLYKDVGYDLLNIVLAQQGMFTSPYAATSIREYFASGFEYYFLDERKYLKQICPSLFTKIGEIHKECTA